MPKVNRVEDLPEWFDLENYDGAEIFGAIEWLEQLERRVEILEFHPDFSEEPLDQDSRLALLMVWPALNEKSAEQIRQQPLFSRGKENLEKYSLARDVRPVKPVSLFDIALQKNKDCGALRDGKALQGAVDRWGVLDSTNPMKITEIKSLTVTPFALNSYGGDNESPVTNDGNARPVIAVNLKATDAVLVACFETWLKEIRAQQPETSKRNRPAYKDWTRYGLLPYLDLLIWSKETGRKIPRRIFSAAVSRYDKGESAFSKTVVPLAASLIKDLSGLKALAVYEALNQNK